MTLDLLAYTPTWLNTRSTLLLYLIFQLYLRALKLPLAKKNNPHKSWFVVKAPLFSLTEKHIFHRSSELTSALVY